MKKSRLTNSEIVKIEDEQDRGKTVSDCLIANTTCASLNFDFFIVLIEFINVFHQAVYSSFE